MTQEYFESIKRGLEEAIEVAQGNDNRVRMSQVPVLNAKALREALERTPEQFTRTAPREQKEGHPQ